MKLLQTSNIWKALGTVETIVGAAKIPYRSAYQHAEKLLVIEAGPDESSVKAKAPVRLAGYLNTQVGTSRGTVLLLHGWEGSSHTSDTLSIGEHLFRLGFDTFRLNFRDHGRTHFLNEGVFSGALISEIAHAAQFVAGLKKTLPFYVVGCSLGGNYAVRLGLPENPLTIPNLEKLVAICPAIDPYSCTVAIDTHVIFRNYFCAKWRRSLRIKQIFFPDRYKFPNIASFNSVEGTTRQLLAEHFPYENVEAYYETYKITRDKLQKTKIPTTLVASRSDPVIPVQDFASFSGLSDVTLKLTQHGGHIGFVNAWTLSRDLPLVVAEQLIQGSSAE